MTTQPLPSPEQIDAMADKVNLFKQYHRQAANMLRSIASHLRGHAGDAEITTLDKPARVGAASFGRGVPWRTVIECAQRAYEAKPIPPESLKQLRDFLDAIKENSDER